MGRKRDWVGIVFGTIWFLMAALILALYLTESLTGSIPIPRVFLFFYDWLGILPGSVVQLVASALVVFVSVRGRAR